LLGLSLSDRLMLNRPISEDKRAKKAVIVLQFLCRDQSESPEDDDNHASNKTRRIAREQPPFDDLSTNPSRFGRAGRASRGEIEGD
jgi:hypothetical protein